MRILEVHPFITGERISPLAGGKGRAAFLLSLYMIEQGHEVAIWPLKERLADDALFMLAEGKIAKVYSTYEIPGWRELIRSHMPSLRRFKKSITPWLEDMFKITAFRRLQSKFNPDIIHNHYTLSNLPYLYTVSKSKVPIVLTNHNHKIGNSLNVYDLVVFPSNYQRNLACNQGLIPFNRTRVIYYPVDPVFLNGDTPTKADSIVFVGLLVEGKGLDILFSAYRSDPELNKLKLYICGDGPLRGSFEAYAQEYKLNAHFMGTVAPETLQRLYQNAFMTVVPSRAEGFGTIYTESLCCGTPIVGYPPNVRELGELIGREVGFVFDTSTDSPKKLAELIRSALESEVLSYDNRRAVMEKARKIFTVERFGSEYLAAYGELISSTKPTH